MSSCDDLSDFSSDDYDKDPSYVQEIPKRKPQIIYKFFDIKEVCTNFFLGQIKTFRY